MSALAALERQLWIAETRVLRLEQGTEAVRQQEAAVAQMIAQLWTIEARVISSTCPTFTQFNVVGCNGQEATGAALEVIDMTTSTTVGTATYGSTTTDVNFTYTPGHSYQDSVALTPRFTTATATDMSACLFDSAPFFTLAPATGYKCNSASNCIQPWKTTLTLTSTLFGTSTLSWTSGATWVGTASYSYAGCLGCPSQTVPLTWTLTNSTLTLTTPFSPIIHVGDCPWPTGSAFTWFSGTLSSLTCPPSLLYTGTTSVINNALFCSNSDTITITE